MRRAEDQRRNGELDAATVSLERALRITPDDALLWQRLAGVRLAQQRHDLVLQLAAKSNALAKADDRGLRSENWRLIAQSRRALGDGSGAREAERQAAALR
jgi:predicted Zn-dependent protease